MVQVYYSIDQILLGYLKGNGDVGQYAAAAKLPIVIAGFTMLWASALYPHASRVFQHDPEAVRRQLGMFTSMSIAVALALAVSFTLVAGDLMTALFGPAFGDAAGPFAILMWATAVAFVSINITHVLLAVGGERQFAVCVTVGAVLNIALNLVLIPPLGATGAAWATLAAEAMVLLVSLRQLTRRLGRMSLELRRIAGAVAATGVMAGVLLLLPEAAPVVLRLTVAGLSVRSRPSHSAP